MKKIVILTGAGISAESGLKTFRGADGLWEGHKVEDVATPDAFIRNPALVRRFYSLRRQQLKDPDVHPNAAHKALAMLADKYGDNLFLITQNVDNLHERAGSPQVCHMHGSLATTRCTHCHHIFEDDADFSAEHTCPSCNHINSLRPDIVWFGEMPLHMDLIAEKLADCDVFAAIGTSGLVYPAAGFTNEARYFGAETVEINLEPTGGFFDRGLYGPASLKVAEWVHSLI